MSLGLFKQFRMGAGALEVNGIILFINFVNKNPVAFNVAVTRLFPFRSEIGDCHLFLGGYSQRG